MRLNVEAIDKLFEEARNQGEVILGLYRMVIPDWDRVAKVHGYPVVNGKTANELCRRCIEFDRLHHPNVMAGGAWLNNGFSTDGGASLRDWAVSMHKCRVEYEPEPAPVEEPATV